MGLFLSNILPLVLYLLLFTLAFAYYCLKKNSGKAVIFSSVLMGIIVGIAAYNFIPSISYDLTRHQRLVHYYEKTEVGNPLSNSYSDDLEIIPNIYSFLISRTGNDDLLQFFVVAVGYSALFYVVCDSRKNKKISTLAFVAYSLLILFGQSTLYYFSGLYNYFAINIFALAFYIDYVKHKKLLSTILYLITPFIHSSMLFPIALLLLFKLNHSIITKKTIIALLLLMILAPWFLQLMTSLLNISLLKSALSLYSSYTNHDFLFHRFYHGANLLIDLSKIVLVIFTSIITLRNDRKNSMGSFSLIMAIAVLLMMPRAIVAVRFASLALFVNIVPTMSILSEKTRTSRIVMMIVLLLSITFTFYNIHTIVPNYETHLSRYESKTNTQEGVLA